MIKKYYGDKKKRHKNRNWQLKSLPKEVAGNDEEAMEEEEHETDMLDFLEDLEEDKSFREGINIYRSK